jgi:soluble lytic murein transglycosylase-like protein
VTSYWRSVAANQKATDVPTLPVSFYSFAYDGDALTGLVRQPQHQKTLQSCGRATAMCGRESEPLLKPVKARVAQLLEIGRIPEAAAELRLALPPATDLPSGISRARIIAALLPAKLAWPELLAFGSVPELLVSPCSREVFSLLYPQPHREQFLKAALTTKVPYELLLALTRSESAFDPQATSGVGAMGLMQLMPKTAERLRQGAGQPRALYQPELNIELGSRYLGSLYEEFDRKWYLAIAAYNAGPEAVHKWLARYPKASPALFVELIPYPETKGYVKKVLETHATYVSQKMNNSDPVLCP